MHQTMIPTGPLAGPCRPAGHAVYRDQCQVRSERGAGLPEFGSGRRRQIHHDGDVTARGRHGADRGRHRHPGADLLLNTSRDADGRGLRAAWTLILGAGGGGGEEELRGKGISLL